MIEGSCLCGGICYEYDGEIEEISVCHCSQCRKAQGSAFAAVSPIDSARDDLPEKKRLSLGTVDTSFVCSNVFQIYIDSKALWMDIGDTHPHFAGQKR